MATQASPVCIEVERRDLENLMMRAQHCAEDLISEVAARRSDAVPGAERRQQRDTEHARWLLSALPALRMRYRIDL